MTSPVQEAHPSSVFSPQQVFLEIDATHVFRVVTLSLTYDFDTQEVLFDIYGNGEFQRKSFDTFDGAKQYLLNLDHEFPEKIPVEEVLAVWELFFSIEGMVGITADVQHVSHWCVRCDNFTTNSFSFLHFPAVPGTSLDEAFLSLKWESGCGVKEIAGKFQDVSGEVQTTLTEMITQAEDSCKDRLLQALSVVETQHSSTE